MTSVQCSSQVLTQHKAAFCLKHSQVKISLCRRQSRGAVKNKREVWCQSSRTPAETSSAHSSALRSCSISTFHSQRSRLKSPALRDGYYWRLLWKMDLDADCYWAAVLGKKIKSLSERLVWTLDDWLHGFGWKGLLMEWTDIKPWELENLELSGLDLIGYWRKYLEIDKYKQQG